jgi:hypothetical protein
VKRRQILLRAGKNLEARTEELGLLVVEQNGTPIRLMPGCTGRVRVLRGSSGAGTGAARGGYRGCARGA